MKKAMRKGLVSLVTGAAMVASPMAFAAQDTSGMQYTSAAEGFYASIRARYDSGREKDEGADIENGFSRIGVSGTNDLGGGLSGFYTYELGVGIENGSSTSTRLGNVGLRGNFGELVAGSFWDQAYNWTHGSTDIANTHSGNLNYSAGLPGRISKSLQYTTPDLNGFQAALRFTLDEERDGLGDLEAATEEVSHSEYIVSRESEVEYYYGSGDDRMTVTLEVNLPYSQQVSRDVADALAEFIDEEGITRHTLSTGAVNPFINTYTLNAEMEHTPEGANAPVTATLNVITHKDAAVTERTETTTEAAPGNPKDDNDLDSWALSARYAVQGFDVAASYLVIPDGLTKGAGRDDHSTYAVKAGYSQDNWYINAWYSEDNSGDDTRSTHLQDREIVSFAGGISVNNVNVYAVYETIDNESKQEDSYATLGVQYNLGSNSRVWIEYAGQDADSDPDKEDYVSIGLRHDF